MSNDHANHTVRCSITECANHCSGEDCCALDRIEVCRCGAAQPRNKEQTECACFCARRGGQNSAGSWNGADTAELDENQFRDEYGL